jgi:hypothetical protein
MAILEHNDVKKSPKRQRGINALGAAGAGIESLDHGKPFAVFRPTAR